MIPESMPADVQVKNARSSVRDIRSVFDGISMRKRVHKFGWPGIALIVLLPVHAMAGGDQASEPSADEERASIKTPAPGGKGPGMGKQYQQNTPRPGTGYPGYRGTGGSGYPQHRQYGNPPLTPVDPESVAKPAPPANADPRKSLLHAAAFGDIEGVTSLLDSGASPNARSMDKRGRTALILATQGGHVDVVEALLEKGAGIEDRDKTGHTALNWAAMRGQAATARVLLEHGADVNTMNNGLVSPVLYAVGTRNKAMVRLMAEAGADLQVETRDNKMTPLLLAIEHQDFEMTRLLVEAGADVNKRNQDGYSPLMAAAEKADSALTKLLLAEGAKVDVRDNRGRTALVLARKAGDKVTVEALLTAGAES